MIVDVARHGIGKDDRLFRDREEWMGRVFS